MTVEEKLAEIETNLALYQNFINDLSSTPDERKVVSFKVLYEMMAFNTLRDFAPDYRPKSETEFMLAVGLKNINNLVNVIDGKVTISQEYKNILQQRDEYLKNNKN